jgi:hypothetical protein
MDFSKLFPGIADGVANIIQTWPFSVIGDVYAPFGAIHLVGLALLGGCVIIMNLRLLGAGLTDESPSVIERNLRVWHIVGASIVIGTGLVIGGLNAERLYTSAAFFVKMISMFAALIFTFGVVNSIAKADGEISKNAKIWGGVAMVLFLFAMGVFATGDGLNPGTFYIIAAAYAVLMLFGSRTRWIAGGAFALLFGSVLISYWVVGFASESMELQTWSIWASWIAGILFVVLTGYEIWKQDATPGGRIARMIAVMSILSWVATAAGGRWIGFS